jgi:putative FmdB family regulatory protein
MSLFAAFDACEGRSWRDYDLCVPVYEFRCASCGERFDDLVPVGTASATCPKCGVAEAERVLSAQAAQQRLVRSPGDARKQERKNAQTHARAKADLSARRRAVDRARRDGGGGS